MGRDPLCTAVVVVTSPVWLPIVIYGALHQPGSSAARSVSSSNGSSGAPSSASASATRPVSTAASTSSGHMVPIVASSPPGSTSVPFTIDLAGNSYDGVAKLEKGHISGQLEAFGKPVNLNADMKTNSVSARLVGALGAQQGNWGGGQCVADGEASPASGRVTIPMQANCPLHDYDVVLHIDLPAGGG